MAESAPRRDDARLSWHKIAAGSMAVLVVVTAIGVLWRRNAMQNRQIAELRQRVAALESTSARVRPSTPLVAPFSVDESAGPLPPVQAPYDPQADSSAQAAVAGGHVVDPLANWEAEHAAEPIDQSWAPIARGQYLTVIYDHLPRTSELVSLECRSRSCRLEVIHESAVSSNEFVENLVMMERGGPLAWTTGGAYTVPPPPTPDGRVRSVVFIKRADPPEAQAPAP